MLPGNTSAFTDRYRPALFVDPLSSQLNNKAQFHLIDYLTFFPPITRKVNGPGTPRPLNRPKLSLANSLAANGLPDSTEDKDVHTQQEEDKDSRWDQGHSAGLRSSSHITAFSALFVSEVSGSGASLGSSLKNKHTDADEDMEAEQQEVKRLKFGKDEEDDDEEDDDDDEEEDDDEEQDGDTLRPSIVTCVSKEAEAMVPEEEEMVAYSKQEEASSSAAAAVEDQGGFVPSHVAPEREQDRIHTI